MARCRRAHKERFEPGSLRLADVIHLDLGHDRERVVAWRPDGGLELVDGDASLELTAELPPIPAADRALDEIRAGKVTGLSVEFQAGEASRKRQAGVRVIEEALLNGHWSRPGGLIRFLPNRVAGTAVAMAVVIWPSSAAQSASSVAQSGGDFNPVDFDPVDFSTGSSRRGRLLGLAVTRLLGLAVARGRRLAGRLLMATALADQDVQAIVAYVARRRLRNTGADKKIALPVLGAAFDPGTAPPEAYLLQIARSALDICAHYASAAPFRVLVEAAVRCAGWMRDSDPGVASRAVVDGTDIVPRAAVTGALRGSGAHSILSPYRTRRLAAVERD